MRRAALALVLLLAAASAHAQGRAPVRVETLVAPDTLRLGEAVTLTWRMWLPRGSKVTFPAQPPDDSLHHWLAWTPATRVLKGEYREHRLTARYQTFALGPVAVPGPPVRFTVPGEEPREGVFPATRFTVLPVVPPDGPEPPLADIHGLVPPPWWATVPWWRVAAVVLGLALLAALIVWLVRRRRRKADAAAPEAAPIEVPEAEARRRLAALVARALPEAGRTYEHGTELADLLRRFVERRFGSPLPGYTTGELAAHLAGRPDVSAADVVALRSILDACDLTKFARRPYDAARAHEAEATAAGLIDRWAAPAAAEAAAPELRKGAA
jgi:Na+-transporting methylmalonyl-CoA/oxaloacetate decarboxylase gamma subunit